MCQTIRLGEKVTDDKNTRNGTEALTKRIFYLFFDLKEQIELPTSVTFDLAQQDKQIMLKRSKLKLSASKWDAYSQEIRAIIYRSSVLKRRKYGKAERNKGKEIYSPYHTIPYMKYGTFCVRGRQKQAWLEYSHSASLPYISLPFCLSRFLPEITNYPIDQHLLQSLTI